MQAQHAFALGNWTCAGYGACAQDMNRSQARGRVAASARSGSLGNGIFAGAALANRAVQRLEANGADVGELLRQREQVRLRLHEALDACWDGESPGGCADALAELRDGWAGFRGMLGGLRPQAS
jgi:hypothetical protein